MQTVKSILFSLVAIVVILALGFGLKYLGVLSYEFFGKEYANADREIFEESKPFIHGSIQNLYRMKLEYETAENEQHRKAIRAAVFAQTSGLDRNHLPVDLQTWMNQLTLASGTYQTTPTTPTTSVTH